MNNRQLSADSGLESNLQQDDLENAELLQASDFPELTLYPKKMSAESIPENIDSDKGVELIQSSKYKKQTDILEQHRKWLNRSQALHYLDKNFSSITWSGRFNSSPPQADNLAIHSGLQCVCIKNIRDPQLRSLWRDFANDEYTHAMYKVPLSGGKYDLNVIAKINYCHESDQVAFFNQRVDYYSKNFGIKKGKFDLVGKNVNQRSYVSCDPNCFLNPHSRTIYLDTAEQDAVKDVEQKVVDAEVKAMQDNQFDPVFEEGGLHPQTDLHTYLQIDSADLPINQIPLTINPRTDLNEVLDVSQWQMGQTEKTKGLSAEEIEKLPDIFRMGCQLFKTQDEWNTFLFGALGLVSGCFPNVKATYDGREIESNLYCYIYGPFGVGKGAMQYAHKLVVPIHKQKLAEFKEAEEKYKEDLAIYEKKIKIFQQDKKGETDLPKAPTPPFVQVLIIPANISKAALIRFLKENGSRGIIYETEADTLIMADKQDYGGFSDILRKAFHHEQINSARKGNNEYTEIEVSYLSVLLSSTFDQLKKMFQNLENGLFSRIIFFEIPPNRNFENVFDAGKRNYSERFNELGQELLKIYNFLNSLEAPLSFDLQEHQKTRFLEKFQFDKDELCEYVGENMGGTVNRFGIMCFRIAMILSILREFETIKFNSKILCTDQDFETALLFIDIVKVQSLAVYWRLQDEKSAQFLANNKDKVDKDRLKSLSQDLFSQGLSYRDISQELFGNRGKKSSVYRWIHE